MMNRKFLDIIVEKFSESGDSSDAEQMQAYMRNQFKFFGIRSPQRNLIQKEIYREYGVPRVEEAMFLAEEL